MVYLLLIIQQPLISTLFPYTTLFRSHHESALLRRPRETARETARRHGISFQPSPTGVRSARAVASSPQSPRRSGTAQRARDRKSTRLNSSHSQISYAVFCLKKKKQIH